MGAESEVMSGGFVAFAEGLMDYQDEAGGGYSWFSSEGCFR